MTDGTSEKPADSAFDAAVEAGRESLLDSLGPLGLTARPDIADPIVLGILTAALPMLLDGLDREALADVLFRWAVPNAGALADEDQSVIDRCLSGADAVIAHLRDVLVVRVPQVHSLSESEKQRLRDSPVRGTYQPGENEGRLT